MAGADPPPGSDGSVDPGADAAPVAQPIKGRRADRKTGAKDDAGRSAGRRNRRFRQILKAFQVMSRGSAAFDRSFHDREVTGALSQPPRSKLRRNPLQEEQWLLWIGFAFALGILTYMVLPEEPNLLALGAVFLAALVWIGRKAVTGQAGVAAILLLSALSGVLVASLRVTLCEAPRLYQPRNLSLEGRVLERQESARGPRLILEVHSYEDYGKLRSPGDPFGGGRLPETIRISIPKAAMVRTGDGVKLTARLFPPSGPARPGGYDFSFWAYFDGLGATGFSYGAPDPVDLGPPPGWLRLKRGLETVRSSIGDRIRAVLPVGDGAELAVALLVGDRSGLSEQAEDALRASGLAHVLAISGLHMALFAGGAFGVALLLLAASETAALKLPSHKVAAVVALLAATLYLALSGASVATQRSYMMISLVFLGLIMSRKGLTLHSVALAGLVLLVLAPERLLHPGFQMSFAAVICLVAVYGTWRTHRLERGAFQLRADGGIVRRLLSFAGGSLAGLLVTALVAGVATGIIGAHHFGRIAPMGLLGNLLGMPVFTLVIMPMGVLALVLMPFGLAALPLKVMEAGLELLLAIAGWVIDFGTDGLGVGDGHLVPPGDLPTVLLIMGLFLVVLARRWFRLAGVPALLLATGLIWGERPPDVQISASGDRIAARGADGLLYVASRQAGFETDIWLQAEGQAQSVFHKQKMTSDQYRCDDSGCVYRAYPPGPESAPRTVEGPNTRPNSAQQGLVTLTGQPLRIAMPKTPQAFAIDCDLADLVVTDLDVPEDCAAELVIAGAERREAGALSLWLETVNDNRSSKERSSSPAQTVVTRWIAAKSRPARPWHQGTP
ncbi:ComEC/Rec2 family competence protein [Roseibium polysiphoniae]|uniref:ComEC family competence protein n=1 Tax=Roseibium polysiphoniae TaxID=2571221 RepID=A0ABR9C7A9_9HYPH|nr:ComEC family competence protein [Roseibium polysiphoniae]